MGMGTSDSARSPTPIRQKGDALSGSFAALSRISLHRTPLHAGKRGWPRELRWRLRWRWVLWVLWVSCFLLRQEGGDNEQTQTQLYFRAVHESSPYQRLATDLAMPGRCGRLKLLLGSTSSYRFPKLIRHTAKASRALLRPVVRSSSA